MSRYDFLVDTYRTERLKTLSLWAQVPEARMDDRLDPRARSPREHMVHQCLSEDTWMRTMFGIAVDGPVLPEPETRTAFMKRYAAASAERLAHLETNGDAWFEQETAFFDVQRPRTWILTRRLTHSAHHRAQLQTCLRAWGVALYSNYGPTADTGGLAANGATVIYRAASIEALLEETPAPRLPGPGDKPPTERSG
jgi:uncharacterized damage-inducible protein DinB